MSDQRMPPVHFAFPDYGDTEFASEPQRRTLLTLLGPQSTNVELGAEHAAVLISICNYVGSIIESFGDTRDPSVTMIFASAVARDHGLVERIRTWGKVRPRRRRAVMTDKLDKDSDLYRRVTAVLLEIGDDPAGYARAKLGPDIPRY